MRKVRLDIETLVVDSFGTEAERSHGAGTVRAHATNLWDCVYSHTGVNECPCNSEASCFDCIHTAVQTCYGSCGKPGCDEPTSPFVATCQETCYWGAGGIDYLGVVC